MSDVSPTDTVDQSSSGSDNEPLLDEGQQPSADEHKDVPSGDTHDAGQDSDDEPQDGSTRSKEASSDVEDDGLAKFAKSQGIEDMSELSERELRILKVARDNQKSARNKPKSDELKDTISEVHKPVQAEEDDFEARERRRDEEIAQIRAENRANSFFYENPEAREYEQDMAKLIVAEAQKYTNPEEGRRAAQYIASDLDRLLVLAKASRGSDDVVAAREAGRREERESLRHRTEAGGGTAHAKNRGESSKKLTRESISQMSDEEFASRRDEIDAAISRGELY